MARLKININSYNEALDSMTINGKNVKVKNKKGANICEFETDKDVAKIHIYKPHIYSGKHWIIYNILYFIVSIFGIFDVRPDKKFKVVDFECDVKLQDEETEVNFEFPDFEDGGKFLDVTSYADITEIANKQYLDKDAIVKHKKMKKIKFGISFVSIISIILLIALL